MFLTQSAVAQLVEHDTFNVGVTSSSLVSGTIFNIICEQLLCLFKN